ncbi:hypothetical protein SAMN05443545_11054 [Aidingimonas halophila]|uniref:Uncharacterized protein n=1 Tax=Aidingimonas halophila TaxID=574349 RepID=A0A1H3GTN6_9GAMM|nr:hypothetical protein SAMN05443545_11054 [Aidingimonas halophila]
MSSRDLDLRQHRVGMVTGQRRRVAGTGDIVSGAIEKGFNM